MLMTCLTRLEQEQVANGVARALLLQGCAIELRTWDRNANVTATGTGETESGIHVLGMGNWGATNVSHAKEEKAVDPASQWNRRTQERTL